jgi:hypothetical protein
VLCGDEPSWRGKLSVVVADIYRGEFLPQRHSTWLAIVTEPGKYASELQERLPGSTILQSAYVVPLAQEMNGSRERR